MPTELIINSRPYETRVALVENGTVVEFQVERQKGQDIAGNIYKGRTIRVLPGMQAAFVDIGLEKAAFLYVTDVYNNLREFEIMLQEQEDSPEGDDEIEQEEAHPDYHQNLLLEEPCFQIQDLVHEGQELMVQVSKGPLGTKGARVTTHISLPGRNLVLMPMVDHVGISRRIEDEKERKRLKDLISSIKVDGYGFIARTAGEGVEEDKFEAERDFLLKLWSSIQKRQNTAKVPSLIHKDLSITLRAVRDLFTKEVDKIVIDSQEEYENVLQFIKTFLPSLSCAVELYDHTEPIFDRYGIEMEVSRAMGKKVWLKSGGYIVIEITEALVSIDVNTGRFVGKRNLEETILKTNLEAVKEIAYQLRLRNIGGLIVIDFIDMEKESNREKVFNALKEALKSDKSKTNVLKMSEFGLIEMTRKRIRENINRLLSEDCFYCDGRGTLKTKTTICYDIFRGIEREAKEIPGQNLYLRVHPEISEMLLDEENQYIEYLERKIKKNIVIKAYEGLHYEQYKIGTY
jgi:ribonuclease G